MKIKLIAIFILIALTITNAQIKITSFSPSAFYTYSNYSDGGKANSSSGFATIGINYKDFITAGYSRLIIKHPLTTTNSNNGYNYDQKMFSLGGTKNVYPFYISLFYSRITGDYSSNPSGFNYTDKLNVFDMNLLYNNDLYFFGFAGNYITLDGFYNLNIEHYSAIIKRLFGTDILFSAAFIQSVISDGRNLSSIKFDFNYIVSKSLSFNGSAALGKRAYFYDNELLAIFNQDETQKLNLSLTIKYKIIHSLTFFANYTYADFAASQKSSKYNINYFVTGISLNIN